MMTLTLRKGDEMTACDAQELYRDYREFAEL